MDKDYVHVEFDEERTDFKKAIFIGGIGGSGTSKSQNQEIEKIIKEAAYIDVKEIEEGVLEPEPATAKEMIHRRHIACENRYNKYQAERRNKQLAKEKAAKKIKSKKNMRKQSKKQNRRKKK